MLVLELVLGLLSMFMTVDATLFESLHNAPQDWYRVDSAPAYAKLHFRIAMTHPDSALLEQTLYDISTPSSTKYGKHMKRDDIKRMLRPEAEATQSVLQWLLDAGIAQSDITDDGETIHFVTTVSNAEQLLDTTMDIYHNVNSPVERIRTLHYSIPDHLHQYIDMIQPTTRFGQIRPQRSQVLDVDLLGNASTISNQTDCNKTITPKCIKSLYNVPISQARTRGFIGITGFLDQYPRYDDLNMFKEQYASYMKNESFTWSSVDGGLLNQTSSENSIEANLDMEYALSVGYPLPGHFYSTAGRGVLVPDLDQPDPNANGNEPYLDFFEHMLSLDDDELPHTLTTSYGEDEQAVPASYAKTVCNMIGQLGLRGVSVLFSSGDTGVAEACQTNDGRNATRFLPIFPASCPYVTSVGGTYGIKPERAVGFSSGGFSDIWARPSYQEEAVSSYLKTLGDRWSGLYNPAGRGFPDVAAQATRFHVVDKGASTLVNGTSASAPTFAAIIGLLNSARLTAGKPPMGFLNPWIYAEGHKGLTDIVDGGSTGCTGIDAYSKLPTPFVPYASWNATVGWDPVTGHGTPDYKKLLKLAMKSRYHA